MKCSLFHHHHNHHHHYPTFISQPPAISFNRKDEKGDVPWEDDHITALSSFHVWEVERCGDTRLGRRLFSLLDLNNAGDQYSNENL
ncbi:hypothetical protein E2C01_094258 [Portunus trituberculatus]|uniref:Uncharacterized protein n=1 Tax=Portunus trituberculatus TaxID=210409 RepID=A0A5B7JWP5_PORTR|nr:hypothetical protein [Portunus trituberculatus]